MDKEYLPGIILGLIIGVVVFGWVIYPEYVDSQKPIKNTTVFHVTLADPALYDCNMRLPLFPSDCKYTETVFLEEGMYEFRFVPNGDSPQKLSVELRSTSPEDVNLSTYVSLHYVLVGNLVEEGMSSWYTWKYQIVPCALCANLGDGDKGFISIDEPQQVEISIDPRGYLNGPISIELVQIK